jgi:hypothetical protein
LRPEEDPLHDFPDRAIRKLLSDPRNLRELLMEVVPDLSARFDFERVEPVDRSFLMDDWRRRESDLLFRIPFQESDAERPALVCVLIEHQSAPDPRMPLRMLLYAALYWEREWKAWEERHPAREPLRLSPVLPVVFHTGGEPWRRNRELSELIGGPEAVRGFAPRWRPLFWDLADRSPEELLASEGEWMRALAVVRAEREESQTFRAVFAEALRRLEALSERETVRWHDLLWFVLSWALRRRPGRERSELVQSAQSSHADASHRTEVQKMSETIELTWEQEMLARVDREVARRVDREVARRVDREVAREVAIAEIRARRDDLRLLLEDRFGELPGELIRRIEQTDDVERLRNGIRRVSRMSDLSDLQL